MSGAPGTPRDESRVQIGQLRADQVDDAGILTLDEADAAGVGCYFETAGEKTRQLYEKRGFRIRDELDPMQDGPTIWTMWRDPQPPRNESA